MDYIYTHPYICTGTRIRTAKWMMKHCWKYRNQLCRIYNERQIRVLKVFSPSFAVRIDWQLKAFNMIKLISNDHWIWEPTWNENEIKLNWQSFNDVLDFSRSQARLPKVHPEVEMRCCHCGLCVCVCVCLYTWKTIVVYWNIFTNCMPSSRINEYAINLLHGNNKAKRISMNITSHLAAYTWKITQWVYGVHN